MSDTQPNAAGPDVLVIGAGVAGLTTAICVAEAGLRVEVRATLPPARTTSAVAGAIWGLHLVTVDDRVSRWGRETLARLTGLAGQGPLADPSDAAAAPPDQVIRLVSGCEMAGTPAGPGDGVTSLPGFRWCGPGELLDGFVAGWRYTAPIVAMPLYLEYLAARLERAGGTVRTGWTAGSLAGAAAQTTARVIVNCTGSEAASLVPDPSMVPVRGQVVVVENPGLTEFCNVFDRYAADPGRETGGLVYMFPHGGTMVLGGSADHGSTSREPDLTLAEQIIDGCVAVEPRLRGVRVLEHRVGLRPFRPTVRVEAEDLDGGRTLVHNYGHGGAGVTLSWGCAAEAAGLALAAARG